MVAWNLEQAAARIRESIVLGARQRAGDHTSARIKDRTYSRGESVLFQKLSIVAVILGVGCSFAAASGDSLVRFKGGIGVIPVSSAAGVANADGTSPNVSRNVVRGVNPPGQIWVIADLQAEVSVDGHIRVNGKGLLLGGGNAIGGTGGQSVFATLICEAAAPFILHNTTLTGVPGSRRASRLWRNSTTKARGDAINPGGLPPELKGLGAEPPYR
jgi:hypothetical protein